MRDTASRTNRSVRRRSLLIAATLPTTFALGASLAAPASAQTEVPGLSSLSSLGSSGLSDSIKPGEPAPKNPMRVEHPEIGGLPAGVDVERVEWLTNRRVALFIRSAAMPEQLMQVQILLARDWHRDPSRTFPEVWALDGLRARDDENGWTIETNIEQFYADKNVNVILPVGGESSFYSDWQRPDNGKNYKWESFLINELIPILHNGYRSNGKRAVVGISMGGTAAVNLAHRHPEYFDFVGSFSGYLDTTSMGMPAAISAALQDGGGYNASAMWGAPDHPDWDAHDPKQHVDKLKNMFVYVSSGSGKDDFGNPESIAKGPANMAGVGLEAISRMTSQTFVNRAREAGVAVEAVFRPSGVHSWEYWQFEMANAWPKIADSLGLSKEDRGADCQPIGAIAEATRSGVIGTCTTNEYDSGAGKAQDFTAGTAYWSPETGAKTLIGRINAKYAELGGPTSWLGFPVTNELTTPDGGGKFVHFQHGSIYWTHQTGAFAIPKDMVEAWGTNGYEQGDLGYPVAEARGINGGLVQEFQHGLVTRAADGKTAWVRGAIADKYKELGTANSALGFPTSNEIIINGGAFQQFENGNIYWSPRTGAKFILYGDIFDAWGKRGYEQGEFGFPTEDQANIPAGGLVVEFQNGTIKQVNGRVIEEKK